MVPEMESSGSYMQGKCSTAEPHTWSLPQNIVKNKVGQEIGGGLEGDAKLYDTGVCVCVCV